MNIPVAIEIFCSCLPLLCAFVPPFIYVLRGGSPPRAFVFAWVALVFNIAIFATAIQMLAFAIERKLGYKPLLLFPDPQGAIVFAFLGWFHALILVLIAMGVRKLVLWKRAMVRRRRETAGAV